MLCSLLLVVSDGVPYPTYRAAKVWGMIGAVDSSLEFTINPTVENGVKAAVSVGALPLPVNVDTAKIMVPVTVAPVIYEVID